MAENFFSINYLRILKWTFIAVIIFVIYLIIYFPNYAKLKRLKVANEELLSKIENLEEEIKVLEVEVQKLDKDPHLYEKLARDNLGVAKEGEIVIDIKE